jgi:hypothetical protein
MSRAQTAAGALVLMALAAVLALVLPGAEPRSTAGGSAPARAAPVMSVSGRTITWDRVGGSDQYVLATKVPGSEPVYRTVDGLSVTPPAVPGATVRYGLRTNVEGSTWAKEVSIAYPKGAGPGLITGLSSGGLVVDDARWTAGGLRPALVRLEFSITTPADQLRPAIEAHAANGSRALLLAGFNGTMPSPEEARNLATWAREFGPRGSFWEGRPDGRLAVREIEFGNETSFGYQYGDDAPGDESYAARARDYALRFRDAQAAVTAADPGVGLLAQADDAGKESSAWVDAMFEAVPDLGARVAGWTVHPYGPRSSWEPRIDRLLEHTAAPGAGAEIPIWVTEWGLASDDGRCLSANYGWDHCMTSAAAAQALGQTLTEMRGAYGDRLGAFVLYQGRDQRPPSTSSDSEHYFGALRSDFSPKGPYTDAVQAVLKAGR